MPGPMTLSRGNQLMDTCIALTITPPASIVTTAVTYANYNVPGLSPLDIIDISIQSSVTTYSIVNAYCGTVGVMSVGFSSETGGTVASSPAVAVLCEVIRCENATLGFAAIPAAIQ